METRELMRQEWVTAFDDISTQLGGERARLEVVGTKGKQHIVTEESIFKGLNIDLKDNEDSVSILLDTMDGTAMTHTVDDVKRVHIHVLNGRVARMEVEDDSGETTVLTVH